MACLVPIGTIYISSVRQQLGLLLVARPFGLAIIDADAVRPLAIEDVAGYFESIRHFALGELELCGEGHEHVTAFISQWRIAFGT